MSEQGWDMESREMEPPSGFFLVAFDFVTSSRLNSRFEDLSLRSSSSKVDLKLTRQVYNLFQDLWNRFPYFEGLGVCAKSFDITNFAVCFGLQSRPSFPRVYLMLLTPIQCLMFYALVIGIGKVGSH